MNAEMNAEILAIGTELLLGEVVNTNAAWISQRLAELGVDLYHHVTVGDNPARIHQTLAQNIERANILITTGGLGPTDDDLTVATLADYFGVPLILNQPMAEQIQAYFQQRKLPFSEKNRKQALKPEQAEVIENPMGTAPGIAWDVSAYCGKPFLILTFPGVPKELYAMWPQAAEQIRRFAQKTGVQPQTILTRFLKFVGIGESVLVERLGNIMDKLSPTVAPYVGQAEVKLRLAVKTTDREQGLQQLDSLQQEILALCGEYYYGADETKLEAVVGEALREQKWLIAVAESCTGGLVSSRLTDIPGSSEYVHLNVVTYSNAQKQALLGVSEESLHAHGAVSPQVAAAMAVGIQKLTGAEVALSLTGIAGPADDMVGDTEKPVGLLYVGVLAPGMERPVVKKVLANPNYARTDLKYWFSHYALHYVNQALHGVLKPDSK